MIWSGLLIYWGDSIPPYQHAHEVYRVGLGHWTLFRLYPDWFWKLLNRPYQLTTGLGYHFLFMWVFAINGIAYVIYLLLSGEWRLLVPEPNSFFDAIQVILVDLHISKRLPAQKKYNGAQRIAYSLVILMGFGSLVRLYRFSRLEPTFSQASYAATGSGNRAARSRSKRSPMVSVCPLSRRSRRIRHCCARSSFHSSQLPKRGTGTMKLRRAYPTRPSTLPLSLPLAGRPNFDANR